MQRIFKTSSHIVHFRMLGTSSGGFNAKYTDPVLAERNLAMLGRSFGSTSATLTIPQCHSDIVEVKPGMIEATGDVLITKYFNHALLLRPADCIPLVLFSRTQPLLALVHCSRQGLEEGIVEKTIARFAKDGVTAQDIQAYIGPCIKRDSYIMPATITQRLNHPSWQNNLSFRKENVHVDIAGFAATELLRLGVTKNDISASRIDVGKSQAYYSHYRSTRLGEPNGRNGVAVALTPTQR